MAEENTDDQEKTEEPSQYRIDEFRQKGKVASSKEIISVCVLATAFFTLLLSTTFIYEVLGEFTSWIATLNYEKAYQADYLKKISLKNCYNNYQMCCTSLYCHD